MKKQNKINTKRNLIDILNLKNLIICITIFILALVSYYILFPSRGYFHSDCTDTIMWAQASFDSSSIFNTNFEYACLLPFGGYLIMIPLVAIFGVSMTAHVLGMLIFFILFVASLFIMLKFMGFNIQWRCFTVSMLVLTLSVSVKLREIFWGHIIYYSLGIFLLFVGMALVYKAINIAKVKSIKSFSFIFNLILIFIWFTLAATNQVETLTLFILPALAGFIGERFFELKDKTERSEIKSDILVLFTMFMGTGVGYLLGNLFKANNVASYQEGSSVFSGSGEWLANAQKFFAHWLTLLGVNVNDGDTMFNVNGAVYIIRIVFALLLIIAPIILTILYPKLKDRASKIFIIIHWTMTALIMIGYVFGKLSAANWRLSPIVCTSVIMTVLLCKYIYQNTDKKRLLIIVLTPILITNSSTALSITMMGPAYGQNTGLYALSDFLEGNGLTYGYATFWYANGVTVVSDSKVQIRGVNITDGVCEIRTYQSEKNWYNDVPGQSEYFLLVDEGEYAGLKKAGNYLISDAVRTIDYKEYKILVFDKNIFS